MKGTNGIQMSLHQRWHRVFKDMKHNCEIKNRKEISDKRFSLTLAKMFEQNVNNCRIIIETAEVTDEE